MSGFSFVRARTWPPAWVAAALLAVTPVARAQAHAGCPPRPASLAAMRSCYRPVLVFSPAGDDPRFLRQEKELDAAADDMMDRFMLLVPVLANDRAYRPPLDAPAISVSGKQPASLRRRFGVPGQAFRLVLIDEDGSAVFSSSVPVSIDKLNTLIDRMPRRREEMQRPDSN